MMSANWTEACFYYYWKISQFNLFDNAKDADNRKTRSGANVMFQSKHVKIILLDLTVSILSGTKCGRNLV